MKNFGRVVPILLVLSGLLVSSAALMADTTETRFFSGGSMSPANEAPAVSGVTASGQATITAVIRRDDGGSIVSGTVYFDIDYSFGAPVTVSGLHIHEGGAGVNGPIRIDTGIGPNSTVDASGTGNISRAVEVTSGAPLTALAGLVANPGGFYVNLHTTVNSGGVMRDQLQTTAQPAPVVFDGGVLSNASFAGGGAPLAPGSIAAVFGKYLNDGPLALTPGLTLDGTLNISLGGTQVKVDEVVAPILYSTFGQVGIQIPVELAGRTSASLQVTVGGRTSIPRAIALDAAVPGIFSLNQDGSGPAAMLHLEGTLVTAANPAQPDEVVSIYGTGLGPTNPALGTGVLAGFNRAATTPTVTIDGVIATVEFAGRAPGFVGLDQLNVRIPADVRTANDIAVRVTSGIRQSNQTTLAARSAAPPVNNPVPAFTSLSPSSAYVGDSAFTMTITGSGFISGSTVFVDNVPRAASIVSDTQIRVVISAADCSSSRSLVVRVENPAPGGGASNTIALSVTPPPPSPDPYDYGY